MGSAPTDRTIRAPATDSILKLLVDPYATAIDRPFHFRHELTAPRSAAIDSARLVPKAILTLPNPRQAGRTRRSSPS